MELRKALLVVMLTVGCSVLMLGNTVTAEQGAAKEAKGSPGTHSDMECCQKKGAQAEGQAQSGKDKSCCEHQEGSHGSHADMACCQQKRGQGVGQAQDGKGQSCCANHEGNHGTDKSEGGSN